MNAPTRVPLHVEMATASRVAAQLIAAGIDETDPDFAELMASETDIQDRLVRVLRAARYTEAQSDALAEIIKDNRERKARLDKKVEDLRSVVIQAMGELGLKKLAGPDLGASLSVGKPKVQVIDPAALPDDVCVFKREPSKTAIAAALAEGPVSGAEWSNPAPVLTVRTR
ncbi:siphovirus Gp157 family protein [Methylobacterium sp. 1973]|uniref:siphovirus Gp157 family protein n=1 Tax=Methylobacterium sp. 1973 TaxID=3156421 RepID=UPI00339AB3FA